MSKKLFQMLMVLTVLALLTACVAPAAAPAAEEPAAAEEAAAEEPAAEMADKGEIVFVPKVHLGHLLSLPREGRTGQGQGTRLHD